MHGNPINTKKKVLVNEQLRDLENLELWSVYLLEQYYLGTLDIDQIDMSMLS